MSLNCWQETKITLFDVMVLRITHLFTPLSVISALINRLSEKSIVKCLCSKILPRSTS